jgi:hypothetical protein
MVQQLRDAFASIATGRPESVSGTLT